MGTPLKLTDDRHNERKYDGSEQPSIARMHDIYTGGANSRAVDLAAVVKVQKAMPDIYKLCHENRSFLRRSVMYMLGQGVRQFIDIGCGIPTNVNTHDIVQSLDPSAKVAYVDMDAAVMEQSGKFLTTNKSTTFICADIRQNRDFLKSPEICAVIDFSKPVGVLMMCIVCFLTDSEIKSITSAIRSVLHEGSYVAITHHTSDSHSGDQENIAKVQSTYSSTGNPLYFRNYEDVCKIFDGLGLVQPGVVFVDQWHPELDHSPPDSVKWLYGGLGKKISPLSMLLIQLQQLLDLERLREVLANANIASSMIFFVLGVLLRFVNGILLPELE